MNETIAYFNHDSESWQSKWLHSVNASRTDVGNGNYNAVKGWDNFGPQTVKWLNENPKQPIEVKDDSFFIRSDGNLAWVDFRQQLVIRGTDSVVNTARGSRVLLRKMAPGKFYP